MEVLYLLFDTCQLEHKDGKISNVGVIFIVMFIAMSLLPRMFEGSIRDSVWAVITLSTASVVPILSAVYLLGDKNGWAIKVLRFGGFTVGIWFFTGVLYQIYGLFAGYEPMSSLASETLQQRLELIFGLAMFMSIIYERWKLRQS